MLFRRGVDESCRLIDVRGLSADFCVRPGRLGEALLACPTANPYERPMLFWSDAPWSHRGRNRLTPSGMLSEHGTSSYCGMCAVYVPMDTPTGIPDRDLLAHADAAFTVA